MAGLLDRERIIAQPGFNRWLVPPAALAIHLSIGMAYGFSVFWLPLSRAVGITAPVECPVDMGFFGRLVATNCDWKISSVSFMYSLFFFVLGSAAAIWGGWLERVGPRKAGFVAALCWSIGFLISAAGIKTHQLWLLWLGSGVLGGIGLGLGYISPVSTLIKWFPDRRGMATGMAIMGFGGGALIGSPLADALMKRFATPTSVGVFETFLVLGAIYFCTMMAGAFGYRIPRTDWKPAGYVPKTPAGGLSTTRHVHVKMAWRTPQFWLIWIALCFNVTAGIGVLGMASPMIQEVFGGKLIGTTGALSALTTEQKAQVATVGAGFLALLSFFNIMGRFFWASTSDKLGRKNTYMVFFLLGIALYAAAPTMGKAGNMAVFAGIFCVIISMYGGGFATVPAYLADLFGTQFVGAIHGRLLTAWSTAGIAGTALVALLREQQLSRGVPAAEAYTTTMYILSCLLVVGLIANFLVKPVADKYFMTDEELAAVRAGK